MKISKTLLPIIFVAITSGIAGVLKMPAIQEYLGTEILDNQPEAAKSSNEELTSDNIQQSVGDGSDGNVLTGDGDGNDVNVSIDKEEKNTELNGGDNFESGATQNNTENNTECTGQGGMTACGSGATFNLPPAQEN